MNKVFASIFILVIIGLFSFWWHTNHLPSNFEVSNMEENQIIILGHGGNGFRADEPINSIASFLKVIEYANDGTELDVQLTNDSILVAFHDAELSRTTDFEGRIGNLKLRELRKLIAKNSIPTVSEVLSLKWKNEITFSFDLKDYGLKPLYLRVFAKVLKNTRDNFSQHRILFESPNVTFLKLMKREGLSELYIYCQDPAKGLTVCKELGLAGISINNKLIEKEQVQLLHNDGFRVMIWGVGSAWDNRSAALKSPDIIQTDNIQHLQQLLN